MKSQYMHNSTRRFAALLNAFAPLVLAAVMVIYAPAASAAPAKSAATAAAEEPPIPVVVSQIHNAPAWAAATTYKPGQRVVNLNEKPAGAYQCVTGGTAAAPAPSGAGDSVKDGGSVVWKFLSEVDYTSLTGWLFDNAPWKTGAAYLAHDYVSFGNPLCSYRCNAAGTGPSTVSPDESAKGYHPGLRGSPKTGADGYLWEKIATIGYTSGKSHIPTQRWTYQHVNKGKTYTDSAITMTQSYTAELWNDAEYVAGAHGENLPIAVQAHQDLTPDYSFGYEGENAPRGWNAKLRIRITAAPGESFMDHKDAPLRYDPASGVAIRNPSGGPGRGEGIFLHDSCVTLDRLQIKSDTGRGVGNMGAHDNAATFACDIIESDAKGPVPVTEIDATSLMDNCLIIGSGTMAVCSKYPEVITHCTIVSRSPQPDSVGMLEYIAWLKSFNQGMGVIKDSAIFGWTYAAARGHKAGSPAFWNPSCANNATDTADAAGSQVMALGQFKDLGVDPLPGTGNHYTVPFDKATFIDPGSDWRIVPTSPLHDIGMSADRPDRAKELDEHGR